MKRWEDLKTGEAEWKAERMPGEGFEAEHQMMGMTVDKYPEGVGLPEIGGDTRKQESRQNVLQTKPSYPGSTNVHEQRRHLSQLPILYPKDLQPVDFRVPRCPG